MKINALRLKIMKRGVCAPPTVGKIAHGSGGAVKDAIKGA